MQPMRLTAIKFIFLLSFSSAYANEISNSIVLFDMSLGYNILQALQNNGFFNSLHVHSIYAPTLKNNQAMDKSITITSSLTELNGKSIAHYSLFGIDGKNQQYRLWWQLEQNSSLTEGALLRIVNLAINSRNNTINETLLNDFLYENDINNFAVRYNFENSENAIDEYSALVKISPSSDHYFWRTTIELILLNSFGLINYFVNKDANIVDWEYQPNGEGFKRKILDGWCLDTNNFRTNSLYHIYAGIIYYQTARSNNYGPFASFIWCFAGSTFWEYIGEYREQVSTNDQIFTPIGGLIFGEGLRQLGLYAERNISLGIIRGVICFILDPMRFINRQLDRWFGGEFTFHLQFINPAQTIISNAIIEQLR
ncbi:MAG: DUF3943 domain-containing protein [Spirochaetes bacterium]|nr:DUF3943 domain-containing protein [Spirochaetota bacterium]